MTPLEMEIRYKLRDYLESRTTLDQLHQWFAENTWEIRPQAPENALVGQVLLLLAEYTGKHRTLADLRNELLPLAACAPRLTIELQAGSQSTTVHAVLAPFKFLDDEPDIYRPEDLEPIE
jgi:hypothetical protein